jgi:hypothetical protein
VPSRAARTTLFDDAFSAFSSRLATPPAGADTLESRLQFWRTSLAYDPTGRFGAPAHRGQIALHSSFNEAGIKVVVIRAGKRAGKSTAAVAEAAYQMARGGKVWIASATLDLCKPIFNPLWRHALSSPYLRVIQKDRAKMRIDFAGGGFLKAVSWGESVDRLEAEPASLVILDEASKLLPDVFDLLMARTMDYGGKLLVLGSEQETAPEFDELCEQAGEFKDKGIPGRHNWAFHSWTTWDNPHIPAEELEEERLRLSDVKFRALYGAERRPNHTLVFPDFDRNKHVRPLPFLENLPVTLWIDPGHNWYSVLAVQFAPEAHIGEVIRVFDEVYLTGTTNDRVIREAQSREWWPKVEEIVIDVAGDQRSANAELSATEQWAALTNIYPRSQRVAVLDGIERTHTALMDPQHGQPRIYFDPRCVDTIDEFRAGYRYRRPREGDRPTNDKPMDKTNHSCKALAYGLVDRYGLVKFEPYRQPGAPRPRPAMGPLERASRSQSRAGETLGTRVARMVGI